MLAGTIVNITMLALMQHHIIIPLVCLSDLWAKSSNTLSHTDSDLRGGTSTSPQAFASVAFCVGVVRTYPELFSPQLTSNTNLAFQTFGPFV